MYSLTIMEVRLHHPFFEEISNWFLPFDENQPIFAEAAAVDTKNDTDRMFTATANRSVQKLLDKLAKINVIHENKAANLKSGLTQHIAKLA